MEDAHASISRLVQSFKVSRVLGAIAENGVADHLAPEESRSVDELASACAISPGALLRSVRLLCAWNVFALDSDNRLRHTPLSLFLRSDHPRSVRYVARALTARGNWRAWEAFTEALHDRNPHRTVWGMDRFAHLAANPDEGRWFDEYMARAGDNRHIDIAEAYDFPDQGTVIDVGGGNGELLRQIMRRRPNLAGILFDRPEVLAGLTSAQLLEGRIRTIRGSFFDAISDGCDIYILTKVLHDWSDTDAARILRSVRQSMSSDALLLVNEVLLDPDPAAGNFMHYATDIQMMAVFDGARERTREEFEVLLEAAKLQLTRTFAAGLISILEVAPLA